MAEEYEVSNHCCGFEVSLDKVDDWKDDTDKWSKTTEVIRCCRETWKETEHCIWHAEVKNKPIEELKAARADDPEQLHSAYLVDVFAFDSLSFRGCGLRYAIFSNGQFSSTEFHDADLYHAKFSDAYLSYAEFHDAALRSAKFHDADLSHTEFHNADLFLAEFPGADLPHADFSNADLSGAKFPDAVLSHTKFHNADLSYAEFHDANLSRTEFHDANVSDAEFHDANLFFAKFPGASLIHANFSNADLPGSAFHSADLSYAEFHDAILSSATFHDAELLRTEFHDAVLSDVNCTDANVRYTDFTRSTLHNALFTRADCRGATFTNALLYETVFADTRINSQTTFHDPTTSRPIVVYEENSHTSEDLPENVHPLEAAEWVYRRLEKLHDENALSDQARDFHISKQEARRAYQDEQRSNAREEFYEKLSERDTNYFFDALKTVLHWEAHFYTSTLQWYVTGHGESIPRIFGSAASLILVSGIVYPLVGGFESSSTGEAYRLTELHQVVSIDGAATFLQSIYFSVITFTTIGYGDLYPTGAWSKVLVGFESLSGAILIALFVFVLGRRVAR